jgi:hypothetical protein
MYKIGEGRYQQVYKSGSMVVKHAILEDDHNSQVDKILEYYENIKGVGINVPDFYGFKKFKKQKILETRWQYCGKDLRKHFKNSSAEEKKIIVEKLIHFSHLANNIPFYPIFEQFTVLKNKIFFIDFYPSRTTRDFASYDLEKKLVLEKKFKGIENRIKTVQSESLKYN